jgi:hypothetical protein
MKAFGLAVMLICLNYMCGIVADLDVGLLSAGTNSIAGKLDYSDLESQMNTNASAQISSQAGWDPIQYVTGSINLFFNVIWRVTFGLPAVLGSPPFSLPAVWVTLFGVVNIIVYTVGAIELFRGISLDWG